MLRLDAALVVLLLGDGCVRAAAPPNVILLMSDDLGWGDVGYNKHRYTDVSYGAKGSNWRFNAPQVERTLRLDAAAHLPSPLPLHHVLLTNSSPCHSLAPLSLLFSLSLSLSLPSLSHCLT